MLEITIPEDLGNILFVPVILLATNLKPQVSCVGPYKSFI